MAVPTGEMPVEEATREVEDAKQFFRNCVELGARAFSVAEKSIASREPHEKERLVAYLILYRRCKVNLR